MRTQFVPINGTPKGVAALSRSKDLPIVVVSRHGLGDNIFFSPCFTKLADIHPAVFFMSSVNAYATIFSGSSVFRTLLHGGVNGSSLKLSDAISFANHLNGLNVDIGYETAAVYHYGLFEPDMPYNDERAFVKGRRNLIELFNDGPDAKTVPRYYVAPPTYVRDYVDSVLGNWHSDLELIAIARYGHTDLEKNISHDPREVLRLICMLDNQYPGRFRYLSLDYLPGDTAVEGMHPRLRSVYGFLTCDSACLYYALSRCCMLISVPTGPMLVGATIPTLKLLTVWRTMNPLHFLDPQFGDVNPVFAMVESERLLSMDFMEDWPADSRGSLLSRWRLQICSIDTRAIADEAIRVLSS